MSVDVRCQSCFGTPKFAEPAPSTNVFCGAQCQSRYYQYIATSEVFDVPGKTVNDWSLNQIELYLSKLRPNDVAHLAYQLEMTDDEQVRERIIMAIFGSDRVGSRTMPALRKLLFEAVCRGHFARVFAVIVEHFKIADTQLRDGLELAIEARDGPEFIAQIIKQGGPLRDLTLRLAVQYNRVENAAYLLAILDPTYDVLAEIAVEAIENSSSYAILTMLFKHERMSIETRNVDPKYATKLFKTALAYGVPTQFEILLSFSSSFDIGSDPIFYTAMARRFDLLDVLMKSHRVQSLKMSQLLKVAQHLDEPTARPSLKVMAPYYTEDERRDAIALAVEPTTIDMYMLRMLFSEPLFANVMYSMPNFLQTIATEYFKQAARNDSYQYSVLHNMKPLTRLFRVFFGADMKWQEGSIREAREIFETKLYAFREVDKRELLNVFDNYLLDYQRHAPTQGESERPTKLLRDPVE